MVEDKSLAEEAQSGGQTVTASPPPADMPVTKTGLLIKKLIPLLIFSIAGLIIFAITSFWIPWINGISLKTDDAYVRADIAPLSTRERGIVSKTLVQDYEQVRPGQILIELKNDDFRDRVNEAQQAVSEAKIKIEDMKSRKAKLDAQILDAKAELDNSSEAFQQFDATIGISKAAIVEAHANLAASVGARKQAEASVVSARADVVKSEKAKKREEALLAEESSTKEKVEQVVDEFQKAEAALASQEAALEKAKADCLAKNAQIQKANQQLTSVYIDQKRAKANVESRDAQVTAVKMERKLLDGEESQLRTALESKKSATNAANVDLGYTTITAPVAGSVGELKVKQGQFVNAGTNVVTLVSATPWVIANFRETQTSRIKIGDKAIIEVDALPGKHWNGHVESIAPASGAQFSLLPPDNASGNFTKITQRIPVKILLEKEQENLTELRPGMSAVVDIHH